MSRGRGRWGVVAAVGAAVLAVTGVAAGLAGRVGRDRTPDDAATASVELVQYRRDEVNGTIQVSLTNRGAGPLRVDRVALAVPGFDTPGPVTVDATVPPRQTVDLRTSYGRPRCGGESPAPGPAVVRLWLAAGGTAGREVRLAPGGASTGLLARIMARECLAARLEREVALRFGPTWRQETVAGAVRLHGTLVARLADGAPPRDLTQLAGTVIYDLAPEPSAARRPLARLDAGHRTASVPVVVSLSRCDGHARGETKKPYAFLVWLAEPGGEEQSVVVPVSAADRARLQAVCPL